MNMSKNKRIFLRAFMKLVFTRNNYTFQRLKSSDQYSQLSMLVLNIILCIFYQWKKWNKNFQAKTQEQGFILGTSYPTKERKSFYVSQAIQMTFHGIVSYSVLVLQHFFNLGNNFETIVIRNRRKYFRFLWLS